MIECINKCVNIYMYIEIETEIHCNLSTNQGVYVHIKSDLFSFTSERMYAKIE